jgi:hypothetical protein
MNWQEFEVFMFIDIDSQDTLMELFSETEPVNQYNGDIEYCLSILEKNY